MNFIALKISLLILNVLVSLKSIHMFQLNSYNLDQQIIWLKKHINDYIPHIILFILSILWFILFENMFIAVVYMFIVIDVLVILMEYLPKKQKKPLVWTKRIIRLFVFIQILFLIGFIFCSLNNNYKATGIYLFITSISPFICFLCFIITIPFENLIRKKFINEAKNILDNNKNIYKIGITGSFGKTSVKYFLTSILKQNYNVCFTKGNFNTPMGATLTIKNDLKSYDDIFVCEMGARRVGDIKELCDIVKPNAGIITDVSEQHLDTFKNINNVLKTKFELADRILSNNFNNTLKNQFNNLLLVNGDNDIIKNHISTKYSNFTIKTNKTIYTYGFNEDNDFYVKINDVNKNGTEFIFYDKINNKNIKLNTSLLGEHNVLNLCAAIAMSILINADYSDLEYIVKNIKPVEHRLEIKKINDNFIIIDDAYNSNIKGAKYALSVLKFFNDYTKILITPGMVELGDKQYNLNKSFITNAADICDYILIDSKTNINAFDDGIKETNFNKEKYFSFNNFNEAYSYVNLNIKEEKKIILIENDLPDNY